MKIVLTKYRDESGYRYIPSSNTRLTGSYKEVKSWGETNIYVAVQKKVIVFFFWSVWENVWVHESCFEFEEMEIFDCNKGVK